MDFVDDSLKALQVQGQSAYDIRLALDEITTNIAKHAYKDLKKPGPISISCDRSGSDVTVVIIDEGPYFDPTKTPPPDLTAELEKRQVGGLGIYFVRRVITQMKHEYTNGRNILTLIKTIE